MTMINFDVNSRLTKWFVWSCNHLGGFTTATYRDADDKEHTKSGEYYVANGTTLCHIFWAILWAPLLLIVFSGFIITMFVMIHIEGHYVFVNKHPDYSPILQTASYFIPEVIVLVGCLIVLIVVFAVIGASRTGFFTLLWQYLKGIKQRVCPLVHFYGHVEPAE